MKRLQFHKQRWYSTEDCSGTYLSVWSIFCIGVRVSGWMYQEEKLVLKAESITRLIYTPQNAKLSSKTIIYTRIHKLIPLHNLAFHFFLSINAYPQLTKILLLQECETKAFKNKSVFQYNTLLICLLFCIQSQKSWTAQSAQEKTPTCQSLKTANTNITESQTAKKKLKHLNYQII